MNDRLAILLDTVEYFFRRLGCKIFGHRWEEQFEDISDERVSDGYSCLRCHESEPLIPLTDSIL